MYYLFILINSIFTRNLEYEISRAKKTWVGAHWALHYTDFILMLSSELDRVKGLMTTFSPFMGGTSWTLTMNILLDGEMNSIKDGF